MKKIIKKHLVNHSVQNQFLFSVQCTHCGKTWRSKPAVFSKSETTPDTESKKIIFQNLYQLEMEQAENRALNDACTHFNYCPVCKRLVCNDCFMICDDLDMCVCCSNQLHEKGEVVGS